MTDSIDLDDIEVDDPEEDSEEDSNYGDWLWRGEGEPEDEPEPSWAGSPESPSSGQDDDGEPTANGEGTKADAMGDERPTGGESTAEDESSVGDDPLNSGDGTGPETVGDVLSHTVNGDGEDEEEGAEGDANAQSDESDPEQNSSDRQPIPGVPRTTEGPVGVPEEQGGAGGGSASSQDRTKSSGGSQRTTNHGEATDPDDMTLALTYEAINRLEDPQFVVASARSWSDWLGIVGKVSTPAIRKFQRDEGIDLDFFGGSETGPDERLADITPDSMFYAERMVLVGSPGDEWIAEAAEWEFIPLETAAEKAEWEIEHEH